MCILFFYANGNPEPGGYKLILASNRDEFYARPALSLSASGWEESSCPYAFGGLDMEPGREGGTWLAISAKDEVFKIGALLNVTGEPKKKNGLGRGPLVANYVTGNASNEEYCKGLMANPDLYNSFNLVTIEIKDKTANILHCSNAPAGSYSWQENEPHGFGNSPPKNSLRKVKYGKELFRKILDENLDDKEILVNKCMELLQNRTRYWPDDELIRRAPNWGENISSINVRVLEAGYGSRTRSVILIDDKNRMDFYEETMTTDDPNDEWKKSHIFRDS